MKKFRDTSFDCRFSRPQSAESVIRSLRSQLTVTARNWERGRGGEGVGRAAGRLTEREVEVVDQWRDPLEGHPHHEVIRRLESFKALVNRLKTTGYGQQGDELRSEINVLIPWVRHEIVNAGCWHTITIAPPPAVGGLVLRRQDLLKLMFDPPYNMQQDILGRVTDMLDQTIGTLLAGPLPQVGAVEVERGFRKGYAFIVMPIAVDARSDDVLDAITSVCEDYDIHAERVDQVQSNDRITDRILESIGSAEFVIVDLTYNRPNVFYEAGYAHGIGKTPIYVAREGTALEFDIKDYPIIFFGSMRILRTGLAARLAALTGLKSIIDQSNKSE
jgi:hypothetical protein